MRVKLGFSNPRNHRFDRGGGLSSNRESVADCGREGQDGYSATNSFLFGVKGEESSWMRGTAGFSVGGGLGLPSLI